MVTAEDNKISGEIVDSCLKIHRALGPGLLEKVYEECLFYELNQRGISYQKQKTLPVCYEKLIVENAFRLDLLVKDRIIVELKRIELVLPIHEAQILTYMKLTKIPLGLLINFNVPLIKDGIKRFVL